MKRLMPSGLISWLAANPNCEKADLFSITLPTGTVMNITEGQWDITVPSGTGGWSGSTTTFSSTQYPATHLAVHPDGRQSPDRQPRRRTVPIRACIPRPSSGLLRHGNSVLRADESGILRHARKR